MDTERICTQEGPTGSCWVSIAQVNLDVFVSKKGVFV